MSDTSTDLELRPESQVTLFGSQEPAQVIERVSEIAGILKDVLKKQRLVTNIKGRDHVRVEGWTLLGTLLGVFPVITKTEELRAEGALLGFEAHCEARTRQGEVVGAATARCMKSESTWRSRDDYALQSMAQTRATSKALRGPLGFVVTVAGYEATPAEEMPDESDVTQNRGWNHTTPGKLEPDDPDQQPPSPPQLKTLKILMERAYPGQEYEIPKTRAEARETLHEIRDVLARAKESDGYS